MKNKSKLWSIQIRDVNLQYESYYLIIQPENCQSFQTPETSLTILPRFEIVNAKSYHDDLFSLDSETSIIISLYLVRQKAALYEFKINIHQLQFIGNDLSEITILKYPLILFEYQNGFYTIEGFKMNSIHFANEPLMAKSFYYPSNIKEQNYNTLLEQRKKCKVSLAELDKMKLIQKLKISEIQQLFNDNLGNYNDNVINQFKVASIGESERLVMEKKSIYHASQAFIDDIKNMLEDKKDSVRELEKVFKLHKEKNNFMKKMTEQLKRIESISRFTNCQLINRAMMEFSYTFFNYNLNDYIKLPPFYNEVFEDSKQILRVDYYMRNEKWISLFFGVVIQMIQYLSKQFNIPLKYPVFSQGTKSAIYLSHNKSVQMYGFTQYSNCELGFKYIRDMLKVLLDYLIKRNIRCSFWKNGINNKISKTLDDRNVFLVFIQFNQFFNEVLKENINSATTIKFQTLNK